MCEIPIENTKHGETVEMYMWNEDRNNTKTVNHQITKKKKKNDF